MIRLFSHSDLDGVGIIEKTFSMSEMWEFSSGEIKYGKSN